MCTFEFSICRRVELLRSLLSHHTEALRSSPARMRRHKKEKNDQRRQRDNTRGAHRLSLSVVVLHTVDIAENIYTILDNACDNACVDRRRRHQANKTRRQSDVRGKEEGTSPPPFFLQRTSKCDVQQTWNSLSTHVVSHVSTPVGAEDNRTSTENSRSGGRPLRNQNIPPRQTKHDTCIQAYNFSSSITSPLPTSKNKHQASPAGGGSKQM